MRLHALFFSSILISATLALPATLSGSIPGVAFAHAPSDTEAANPDSPDDHVEIDIEAVYQWAAEGSRCAISPDLLHAVGAAASSNGLGTGSGYDRSATSQPPIFGATGNGEVAGLALLVDTDDGVIDSDADFDRPVGPFQFLPSSWERYGYDANQDGIADPQNLWDASASAANFLCEMGAGSGADERKAILRYAGSRQLTDRIIELYSARRAANEEQIDVQVLGTSLTNSGSTNTDSSQDSTSTGGELVVLSQTEFSELEDIDVVSAHSLLDPALAPQEALTHGHHNGRVALNESGEPFVYGFGTNAHTLAWGDWDADGDADVALVGAGIRLQPDGVVFADFDGGDLSYSGDWDGDGRETPLVTYKAEDESSDSVFVPVDDDGIPYGAQVRLADSTGATVLIGDWDGDGRDSVAVRLPGEEGSDTIQFFDRFGLSDLSPVEIDSDSVALVVPREVVLGTEEEVEEVEMVSHEEVMLETVATGEELRVVTVGGMVVAESIAEQVEALLSAAEADGISLQGWGWRSHERQIELRIAHCAHPFETPSNQCSPPTATPGHSRHEFGLAIDFHVDGSAISASTAEFEWLTEHAHEFGLFNLPSEPWHWSVDGR